MARTELKTRKTGTLTRRMARSPLREPLRSRRKSALTCDEPIVLGRISRVVSRALEVFEDDSAALDWLASPNAALDGRPPLKHLDTEAGTQSVLNTLGRIEHGVFD